VLIYNKKINNAKATQIDSLKNNMRKEVTQFFDLYLQSFLSGIAPSYLPNKTILDAKSSLTGINVNILESTIGEKLIEIGK
jgi:hypothetical protein